MIRFVYLFRCSRRKNDFAITDNPYAQGVRSSYCNEDEYDFTDHPLEFIASCETNQLLEIPFQQYGLSLNIGEILAAMERHHNVFYYGICDDDDE